MNEAGSANAKDQSISNHDICGCPCSSGEMKKRIAKLYKAADHAKDQGISLIARIID